MGKDKISIDGDYLEGGGQIVRTSLTLSVLTEKSIEIRNIRAGRPNPGLKEQHLQAIKTLSRISNGQEKSKLGDKELIFNPKNMDKQNFECNIRTAGSVAMILNTVMPIAYKNKINLRVNGGGTWNKFAPPVLYLEKILLPFLNKLGFEGKIKVKKEGFFPKGGSRVNFNGEWKERKSINLTNHHNKNNRPDRINIYSIAEKRLKNKKVGERQAREVEKRLKKEFNRIKIEKNIDYVKSDSIGSGLLIKDNHLLGSDSLGEKGKSSEEVGREAVEKYLKEIKNNAVIDKYGSDQIMIFMALSTKETGKKNKIKTSKITNHAKTNAYIIEKFLPIKFKLDSENSIIECLPGK